MAFRIEAAICCVIAIVAHQGTVTFTDTGVSFNSRALDYTNIERLELSPAEIRLRTYESVPWRLGRNREYKFDRLAPGQAQKLYPFLRARLDQRFIARLPAPVEASLWQVPAKMLHRSGGFNGELKIGADHIAFEGAVSRTWRYIDITNLSSSSRFGLTLTSLEGETRFQLKQALPEERFNELWRSVMEANGLTVLSSQMEGHHD